MAYCVLADVQKNLSRFILDVNSNPNPTEAESMIDGIAADIDVRLARHDLTVPATTPSSFITWLKEVNTWGATASVLKAMFPAASGTGSNPAFQFWETRYQAAIKLIESGEALPTELAEGAAYIGPSAYFIRNPDEEETLGDIAEPRIKIGKDF